MRQFDIYIANLDPTVGAEMKKTRPVVILSNNIMNNILETVIIAPLTSTYTDYPFRIDTDFDEKGGQIALDHVRSISKDRLQKRIGKLSLEESGDLIDIVQIIFSTQ